MRKLIGVVVLIGVVFGCQNNDLDEIPFEPDGGWFPETPINISELNTSYDEYSSNINGVGMNIHVYYSSNVENQGAHFNIQGAILSININQQNNSMNLTRSASQLQHSSLLFPLINSEANEHGVLSFNANFGSKWYFFYANDKAGQYEIEYVYQQGSGSALQGPFNAKVLNSSVCDFYPSINAWQTEMVFSSYRDKKYDIYQIEIKGDDFIDWLNTGTNTAVLNTTLSSSSDDKSPCLNGKLLVLASDREGGYGGYDLWYSIFNNGQWNNPVNFGPEINTEYDEFGPTTAYFPDSNNDILIFSSNRPGGKGGYDFYFVGIPKMIK